MISMTPVSQAAYNELLRCGFQRGPYILRKRYVGKYVDCNIGICIDTNQVSVSWLPKQETEYDTPTFHDIGILIAGTHNIMLEIPILESELKKIAVILAL